MLITKIKSVAYVISNKISKLKGNFFKFIKITMNIKVVGRKQQIHLFIQQGL
jgi:hypothetical protein